MMADKKICYSVFIEDKPYLLWQLELFLYSLTKRAKIDPKDIFLFWSSPDYYSEPTRPDYEAHQPSEWLTGIIQAYPTMHHRYSQNFGRQNRTFRFMGKGHWHGKPYAGLNKWSAWIEWANADCFKDWEEVWILEQDLWFSGKIPKVPDGNVVSYNWIPQRKTAFKKTHADDQVDEFQKAREFKKNGFKGQNLEDIMRLTGMNKKKIAKWEQGAVLFKFNVADLKPKLLNDIMNYNYLLIHLMEIKHPLGMRHETDMIAPSLAIANSNLDIVSLRDDRLRTDTWTHDEDIPQDTIVHYGWDFKNYPHLNAKFGKHEYGDLAPWQEKRHDILKFSKEAKYEWTQNFFKDMLNIHLDFPNILRRCTKKNHELRV